MWVISRGVSPLAFHEQRKRVLFDPPQRGRLLHPLLRKPSFGCREDFSSFPPGPPLITPEAPPVYCLKKNPPPAGDWPGGPGKGYPPNSSIFLILNSGFLQNLTSLAEPLPACSFCFPALVSAISFCWLPRASSLVPLPCLSFPFAVYGFRADHGEASDFPFSFFFFPNTPFLGLMLCVSGK